MKRLSRESWIAIGLCLLLVLVTLVAAIQQARRQGAEAPPLSSSSRAPDGARALWLWLGELGYTVSSDVGERFLLPEGAGLVLILEPSSTITDEEWQTIDGWVEGGGTLVLAGEGWNTGLAARHYDFELSGTEQVYSATLQTPLFLSPPLTAPLSVQSRAYLETDRSDVVPHLAEGPWAVLVSFRRGAGRVILSATAFPFSNAGLKEKGNPALVLNVVSAAGEPAVVWFDEWHHGLRPAQPAELAGPGDWLRRTPAGHALLYAAGVVLLTLAWQGRRFGRPVPLPGRAVRRSALEYVRAIANLRRRAGHRAFVLRQYRQTLKRGLGRRYRLSPALPDEEYVARLSRLNPQVDAGALSKLLAGLEKIEVSEAEMVQLAAEVAQWLENSP